MREKYKRILVLVLTFVILLSSLTEINAATVTVDSTKYGYTQLTKKEKNVYKLILQAINSQKTKVTFTDYKEYKNLDKIYQVVLSDYPEIFWVKKAVKGAYTKNGKTLKTYMTFSYTMSKDKMKATQKKLKAKAKELLKDLPEDSDYEKVKYIYELVAENVTYDMKTPTKSSNQLITSAMLNGKSVCAGYNKMYVYLLQQAGLKAMCVHGKSNGVNHSWALVRVNKKYYYSDITFGDIEYGEDDDTNLSDYVNYTYLLEPESDFKLDHVLSGNYIKLPVCDSVNSEYFRVEDLYFTKITKEERDFLKEKAESGEKVFQLRCNVSSIVDAIRDYLYTLDNIYGLSIDDERNIITVFVD